MGTILAKSPRLTRKGRVVSRQDYYDEYNKHGLLDELIIIIMTYLPLKDLGRVRTSCKSWQKLLDSSGIWKALVEQEYGSLNAINPPVSWFKVAKTCLSQDLLISPFLFETTRKQFSVESASPVTVVLAGSKQCGKSTIATKLSPNSKYPTLYDVPRDFIASVDYYGRRMNVVLQDRNGACFSDCSKLPDPDATILVFSTTSRQSFEVAKHWLSIRPWDTREVTVLVGTKSDLVNERQVPKQESIELAIQSNCGYIEVSGTEGTNINRLLRGLLHIYLYSLQNSEDQHNTQPSNNFFQYLNHQFSMQKNVIT